ncbi:MAG: RNA polymerase sigma factor [Gemmatimonadaceae bacterium]|nr:RNA polymerase sigma factor [Gemmatimonadaceae bacterium]
MTDRDTSGLLSAVTDADLVRQALAGHPQAFEELVDRHYDRCLRYAARLLGNREDAEEACQDAFLRAYRALDSYAENDRFGAWLFRILINRCRSYAVRRRGTMEDATDSEVLASLAPVARDATVELLGLREELSRAIARLEVDQREAFLLKHVDDLSYDEISAITGASVSALKMRVKRACDRLRELLTDVE